MDDVGSNAPMWPRQPHQHQETGQPRREVEHGLRRNLMDLRRPNALHTVPHNDRGSAANELMVEEHRTWGRFDLNSNSRSHINFNHFTSIISHVRTPHCATPQTQQHSLEPTIMHTVTLSQHYIYLRKNIYSSTSHQNSARWSLQTACEVLQLLSTIAHLGTKAQFI